MLVGLRQNVNHLSLPSILLAGIQSLDNKLHKLKARITLQQETRACNIICLTENWLLEEIEKKEGEKRHSSASFTSGGLKSLEWVSRSYRPSIQRHNQEQPDGMHHCLV